MKRLILIMAVIICFSMAIKSFIIKSKNTTSSVKIFDLNEKFLKSINDYSGENIDITEF